MATYDRIARQWHRITGYSGGAFKKYVLNDRILARIDTIHERTILELGAGNGYFMSLLLDRFSGQHPAHITITDISEAQLETARTHFYIKGAEYRVLDVRADFPFEDVACDLILAVMVFNELSDGGLRRALVECCRVLSPRGQLLIAVTHPDFIDSLARRDQLKRERGYLTMPGAEGLRLPVVPRKRSRYEAMLGEAGLAYEAEDIFPDERVLHEKQGLKHAGDVPLGLLFTAAKPD